MSATLLLCQLCAVTVEDGGQSCHPEHTVRIEGNPKRDKRGRVIDCAQAATQQMPVAPRAPGA